MSLRFVSFLSLALVLCFSAQEFSTSGNESVQTNFIGEEIITCNHTPIKANRTTILDFIESFCAEALGQRFGRTSNYQLKEIYDINPSSHGITTATHVELVLRTVNGCSFVVDESCGRYLTRPTDECNVGEEAKQGGWVTDGCSHWTTAPKHFWM